MPFLTLPDMPSKIHVHSRTSSTPLREQRLFQPVHDENHTCISPYFLYLKSHSFFQSYRAILPTSVNQHLWVDFVLALIRRAFFFSYPLHTLCPKLEAINLEHLLRFVERLDWKLTLSLQFSWRTKKAGRRKKAFLLFKRNEKDPRIILINNSFRRRFPCFFFQKIKEPPFSLF